MRIELHETFSGEFDAPSEELATKLEVGVEQLRHVVCKSNGQPDGRLLVIDEIVTLTTDIYEKRANDLKEVILRAIREGGE